MKESLGRREAAEAPPNCPLCLFANLTLLGERLLQGRSGRTKSEHARIAFQMARRPDREKAEILSEKDLKELRYNLAHLSVTAVRDFYEQAYQDCRLV